MVEFEFSKLGIEAKSEMAEFGGERITIDSPQNW
jgi:hypothetical protein